MKILGIDPGVATVGFGLVESSGMHQRMISLRRHHDSGAYPALIAP